MIVQATPWESGESGESGEIWGIAADSVFDGERFVDRPTVLVSGGAIVAVGEHIPESLREAHRVVELAGVTVLPGLVDCHHHLCFDGVGTLDEQVSRVDDEALAVRARASAPKGPPPESEPMRRSSKGARSSAVTISSWPTPAASTKRPGRFLKTTSSPRTAIPTNRPTRPGSVST